MIEITKEISLIANYLEGKKIALGITGSIAAFEAIKISRELRRFGAKVKPYFSKNAKYFITETSIEWATNEKPVTELSGLSEHLLDEDLFLICPATANIIAKLNHGIADDVVSTKAIYAEGKGIPIVIAPAMHINMYKNKTVQKNIKDLKKRGYFFIEPRINENAAKLAKKENIIPFVIRLLSKGPLKNKKVLITAGPTREYIDQVRFITNMSTGKLGVRIAKEFYLRGADVTLIYGRGYEKPPDYLKIINIVTTKDMLNAVLNEINKKYDIGIFAGAVSDFTIESFKNEKISSKKVPEIKLKKTKKIVKEVSKHPKKPFSVDFKLEYNKKEKELLNCALKLLKENNADLVIANDLKQIRSGKHIAYIIDPKGNYTKVFSKDEIAVTLVNEIEKRIKK